MVGILLMTHAPLGSAFLQAAAHVFRAMPERLEAIDVIADQNTDQVHQLALEAVRRLDSGAGVLVLTDMMGGTPSNCCGQLGAPDQVAVIAGISLPMLLRALTYRHDALDVVVEMALAGGQNGAMRVDNRVRI
ncbi:PTS sugar transporter subunit IIA [Undibacterium rugosum]|uniref:PTS fructose transporter subunit IIA n=1 Tax=Undibacterium rugosum TaxID=2762291 RepID=A0A923I0J0_9BURK|nr:PTS fructose transporter subunit IIA [Undibacterium rugosum]MBC3934227.1 PTS fructose transporter subunit IIA [Undibacterium rugosum]MBR7779510.1 PTS fructose transporter subunit IIA [Undibacterium rugosum]